MADVAIVDAAIFSSQIAVTGHTSSVPLARALGNGNVVHRASPVDVCDALLDAALASRADVIWIDPLPLAEDRYLVTLERQGDVVVTSTLDAQLATALIARLALLAEIDLVSRRVQTGTIELRSPRGAYSRARSGPPAGPNHAFA